MVCVCVHWLGLQVVGEGHLFVIASIMTTPKHQLLQLGADTDSPSLPSTRTLRHKSQFLRSDDPVPPYDVGRDLYDDIHAAARVED